LRNTYNIGLLRRRILDALPRPLSVVGETAVEGFLSLAGVSAWNPNRLGLKELSYIFDIGLPLALIGDNVSSKAYAMHVADCVHDGRYPNEDRWRVVHAGALLSRWGAAVQFKAEPAEWAPQIEMQLPDGETLDVYVWKAATALLTGPVKGGSFDEQSPRSHLLLIDVRGTGSRHEEISATLAEAFVRSERLSGVLSFEPRFWIGVEQKEWLHLARLNPNATVAVPAELLGNADHGRHALRLPLLI
jgi:hypothetical protein